MMRRNIPRFVDRDFSRATPVDLILKDPSLIHQEVLASGVPLPMGAFTQRLFVQAVGRGIGDDNMAALVRFSEEPASTTVAGSRPKD